MPELRKDPVIDRWVIIATERAKRPSEYQTSVEEKRSGPGCVFCPGNEEKTPPEVFAYRNENTKPDTPGWSVRVFPNKFPALVPNGQARVEQKGIYTVMEGVGAHEVLVETPDHSVLLQHLDIPDLERVVRAFRQRYLALSRENKYVLIFKNHGAKAGASLEHPHCQIIATPLVPKAVTEELQGSKKHHAAQGRCVYCDMVRSEVDASIRVVFDSDQFISFCPYASIFPFETWIVPKQHANDFGDITEEQVTGLAEAIRETLSSLERTIGDAPYNLVLHTSPPKDEESKEHYHWHIEITPRLTTIAGFELGTSYFINPTPPEIAAEALGRSLEGRGVH